MIGQSDFFKAEADAPLLNLERGFLRTSPKKRIETATKWLKNLGLDAGKAKPFTFKPEKKPKRIFLRDAERTFFTDKNRQLFIKILTLAEGKFYDYQQTLGYVASWLLLFFDGPQVLEVLVAMNFDPKFIPGYWKHEPIALATDAWVFWRLVEKQFPRVHDHILKEVGIYPDNFCQKWFGGLCIHILPFEHLFVFFDEFTRKGFRYLLQFGMSLIQQLEDVLLSCTQVSEVLVVLCLDSTREKDVKSGKFKVDDVLYKAILQNVDNFNFEDENFQKLREEAYEKSLRRRMISAAKSIIEIEVGLDDEDFNFSDETEL